MGKGGLPKVEVQLCIFEADGREERLIFGHAVRQLEGSAQELAILGEGYLSPLKVQQTANNISLKITPWSHAC